jgi:Ca-activated chloride channel family protein
MTLARCVCSPRVRQPISRLVRGISLGASIALGLALAAAPSAQRAPLVLVDVAVEGANGQLVTGLTRDDFEISTGGSTRPIESFASGRELPLSLVVLFDISASMDTTLKRNVIRSGVEKGFVDRLAARDRVQVGAFGKQITIGPPIVGNPRALLTAVRRTLDPRDADTLGPSPIWDAVDAAVTALVQADGRRAVLLVTDGRGTGNRHSPEEVSVAAALAGVAVSVLGEDFEMTIRQDGNTGVRVQPGAALRYISRTTGGLYLADDGAAPAPGPLLVRLLDDLHGRYTLGFAPAVLDGKTHTLDIKVNRPGVTLRARRTYVAPAER